MDAIELRRLRAEADYYEREVNTMEAASEGLRGKTERAAEHAESTKRDLDAHLDKVDSLRMTAAKARDRADEAELEYELAPADSGSTAPAAFKGNDATVSVVENDPEGN